MSYAKGGKPSAQSLKPVATNYFSYFVQGGVAHRKQYQVWNVEPVSVILQGHFTNREGKKQTTYFAKKHMLTLASTLSAKTFGVKNQPQSYFDAAGELRAKGQKILDKRVNLPGGRNAKYGFTLDNAQDQAANTFIVCTEFSDDEELRDIVCGAVADGAGQNGGDSFKIRISLPGAVLDVRSDNLGTFLNGVTVLVVRTDNANTYAITHMFGGW